MNCQQLIQKLKEANDEETVEILKGIQTWHFGKVCRTSYTLGKPCTLGVVGRCSLFHKVFPLNKKVRNKNDNMEKELDVNGTQTAVIGGEESILILCRFLSYSG